MEYGKRRAGRARRNAVATIASLALAAGIIGLPAIPASADATCKVNGATKSLSDVQFLLGPTGTGAEVKFAGHCEYNRLDIGRNVKIVGLAGASVDGNETDYVFSVGNNLVVSFSNLIITEGSDNEQGGGVHIDGGAIVSFSKVQFLNNGGPDYDVADGAAIWADEAAQVTITSSTFVNNEAYNWGGAIYGYDARITISRSTFTGNSADQGGAIYLDAFDEDALPSPEFLANPNPVTISGSAFTGNFAGNGSGGVLLTEGVPLTVSSSTFTRNTAIYGGGALYFDNGPTHLSHTVSGSTFTGNEAGVEGGALALTTDDEFVTTEPIGGVRVLRTKFVANRASDGGAISVWGVDALDVGQSTFSGNAATGLFVDTFGAGGAIASVVGYVAIAGSTFTGNAASWAGGALIGVDADVEVSASTFTRNSAQSISYGPESGGGAIALVDGFMGCFHPLWTIEGSKFASNSSTTLGGAIAAQGCDDMTMSPPYGYSSSLLMDTSTFTGNTAVWGGAVAGGWLNIDVRRSTFSTNRAGQDGGAIWFSEDLGMGMLGSEIEPLLSPPGDFAGWLATDSSTRFTGNRAANAGGAIFALDANVGFAGFATGNVAGGFGGALWVLSDYSLSGLEISSASIERNTAGLAGGGVWFTDPNGGGGDFYIYDDAVYARSEVCDPSCWAFFSGPWGSPLTEGGRVSISYNKVTNVFGVGGGIYVDEGADVEFLTKNQTPGTILIQRNSAKGDGGGLYVYSCLNQTGYFDSGVLIQYNGKGGAYLGSDFDLTDTGPANFIGNSDYDVDGFSCV